MAKKCILKYIYLGLVLLGAPRYHTNGIAFQVSDNSDKNWLRRTCNLLRMRFGKLQTWTSSNIQATGTIKATVLEPLWSIIDQPCYHPLFVVTRSQLHVSLVLLLLSGSSPPQQSHGSLSPPYSSITGPTRHHSLDLVRACVAASKVGVGEE